MNISFQGIKNAGAYKYSRKKPEIIEVDSQRFIKPKSTYTCFKCELTNENGNDLDDFKQILNKYPYVLNPNALKVDYNLFYDPYTNKKSHNIFINEHRVEIKRETIPELNKILKLFKRIAQIPDTEIKTNYSYIDSKEAMSSFRGFVESFLRKDENGVETFDETGYLKLIDEACTPKCTKLGAKSITKKLTDALTEFIYTE